MRQKRRQRAGDERIATPHEEDRLHHGILRRQVMHGDLSGASCGLHHGAGQQRHPETSTDTGNDGVQGAELEQPDADDALPRQPGLQPQPVGATRAQHDDAEIACSDQRIKVVNRRRGEGHEHLVEHCLGHQVRMIGRATDKGAVDAMVKHVVDKLAGRAGAQRDVDVRVAAGMAGEQGCQPHGGRGFQRPYWQWTRGYAIVADRATGVRQDQRPEPEPCH